MTIKNDELDRAIAEAARSVDTAKAELATAKRGTEVTDEEGNVSYEVSQDTVDAATRALARHRRDTTRPLPRQPSAP